jgi:predicted esterase
MQTYDVLSIPTDVFHIKAPQQSAKKVLLFFIGGNPGTIEFYTSFLKDLSPKLNSISTDVSYEIFCPGHANHHLGNHEDLDMGNDYKTYGLDFQIEHKIAFIHNILDTQSFGEPNDIILIGHSIGAYMILEMLNLSSKIAAQTKHISLLMPFIFWENIPLLHKLKLRPVVWSHTTQYVVTQFIQSLFYVIFNAGIVPKSLIKWVVNLTTINNKTCTQVDFFTDLICNRFFTPRMVGNFLHMGGDEIRNIPRDEKKMLNILRTIHKNQIK